LIYTISDGHGGTASALVTITVGTGTNHPPVASAPNVTATPAHNGNPDANPATFTLDGTSSSDVDGDALIFAWKSNGTTIGTSPTLTLSRSPGDYSFVLTVTDTKGASDTKTVNVHVNPEPNQAPIADAVTGTTTSASPGQTIKLGGGSSSDPDGDVLTYTWYEGATVIANGKNQNITLPGGVHTVTLVVKDPYGATGSANVTITVAKIDTTLTVSSLNGKRGTVVSLKATLKDTALKNLAGKTISFSVGGVSVGTAITATNGQASLNYTVPQNAALGGATIDAMFAGDSMYNSSTNSGTLTVKP
jgi:hypothetical protein